ncbi:hypothetical protein HID58_029590, partial [Brassica napus]
TGPDGLNTLYSGSNPNLKEAFSTGRSCFFHPRPPEPPSLLLQTLDYFLQKNILSSFDVCFLCPKCRTMPKIKTNRVKYPEGWELIEPTLRELDAKMREAEMDEHDGKRKCEALWPIFKLSHQRSRYVYDLYYRREEISKELYEFCLDQGYADRSLIAKWKKFREGIVSLYCTMASSVLDSCQDTSVYAACAAYSRETTTMEQHVYAVFPNTCVKRKLLNAFTAVVKDAPVAIDLHICFLHDSSLLLYSISCQI